MERCRLKIGMQVGIIAANGRRSLGLRRAEVVALIDRPGYRRNLAEIRYEDTGRTVRLSLWRLAPLPRETSP